MMIFKGLVLHAKYDAMFDKAQNALDKKCIELMEPYTPVAMDKYPNHGKMSRSHKQEKSGIIINTEPKARREYYTNKGGSGLNRGKLWFERMKLDHRKDLLDAAKEGSK